MDLSPKMFRDIPKVISYHWKEGNFNWPMIIYISLVHAAATYGIFKVTQCSKETLFWAFCLWPIRYDSHGHCSGLNWIFSVDPMKILTRPFVFFRLSVVLESRSECTDFGRIDRMKPILFFDFSLCFATLVPIREAFITGLVIIAYTINSRKQLPTLTMQPVDFSLPTWAGCLWKSTRM